MTVPLDALFLAEINQHLGIAHKVCRMYIPAYEEREDLLQETGPATLFALADWQK